MLIHSKLFNKTFSYSFQNNFTSKPNLIHSKYLYFEYQITNDAQLKGLHKWVVSFKFIPFKVNKTKNQQL